MVEAARRFLLAYPVLAVLVIMLTLLAGMEAVIGALLFVLVHTGVM